MILSILLVFIITILIVSVSSILKYGFNYDTLKIIFSRIARLRGFFFLLLFICACINIMKAVGDNSKFYMLPFIGCGIAAMLSLYRRTRTIAIFLFITIFFGSFFIAFPLIGLLSSYKSGNLDYSSAIFGILFVIVGFIICIYLLKKVIKQYLIKRKHINKNMKN